MKSVVWAPRAERVELVLVELGARLPMAPQGDAWYTVEDERLRPGTRYAFSLDGGPPLPDPRSLSQPEGVHAASEAVSPSDWRWSDAGFRAVPFERAVLYELHVGTFTPLGTLDSAVERLPQLCALGVTHVEVMPVAAFPGEHGWGYDGVYPYAVHAAYGGPQALQRFVDACHSLGLAVILDVVYNHLGPSGCYLARYGPYFTGKYKTPWGEALNFDGPDSDAVRRFVRDNAVHWLEHFHIDGLRLDAVQELFDASPLHILEQLQEDVAALATRLQKPLFLLAETPANDPRLLRPTTLGGYGLRAQWNDDFHHALRVVLTQESAGYFADYGALEQLARAFTQGYVYQGEYSRYRRRAHGRAPQHVQLSQFVVFAQNHDQVGNRPAGDRLSARATTAQLKQAATLVWLSPSVPLLFMGEEWAASTPFPYFVDHLEPELNDAVRRGRLREFAEFGWAEKETPDPAARATFLSAKLRWEERTEGAHAELLEWHTALSKLRSAELRRSPPTPDDVVVRYDAALGWFALRVQRVVAVLNFGTAALGTAALELPLPALELGPVQGPARSSWLMRSDSGLLFSETSVTLPPGSTLVWVG